MQFHMMILVTLAVFAVASPTPAPAAGPSEELVERECPMSLTFSFFLFSPFSGKFRLLVARNVDHLSHYCAMASTSLLDCFLENTHYLSGPCPSSICREIQLFLPHAVQPNTCSLWISQSINPFAFMGNFYLKRRKILGIRPAAFRDFISA
ncbi:hypothetical protein K435DRAFT_789554 [Dendrothele bispora CBS 962.96]|uniref:Uncharacterized protein n=1 Tax=Dendrothele bispora (strain CBS 962.96) TaxID=1314807 RepID=A0A4S8MU13_DENBC|nr:hypothetical protein K435DRAFT_789554 [Dendrothele bispora CBS 962.96]